MTNLLAALMVAGAANEMNSAWIGFGIKGTEHVVGVRRRARWCRRSGKHETAPQPHSRQLLRQLRIRGGVERGQRNIALVNICRLAEALDIAPAKLMMFE